MDRISLRCPDCGRTGQTPRLHYDPAEAHVALITCDACAGGDFGTTRYEDAEGNEVLWQPEVYNKENG